MGYFDAVSASYDTDERMERAKAIADEIRLHLDGASKKSALEYGCGTGMVGFRLLDEFDSLMFVDSSQGMIEQVKRKLSDSGKSTGNAICCDFIAVPPQDIAVDCVFTSLTLHHIRDTKAILTHFRSILNDGGKLLVIELTADDGSFHGEHPGFDGYNGFEPSELARLAAEVGFKDVCVKTFFYGSKTTCGEIVPYSLFILDATK